MGRYSSNNYIYTGNRYRGSNTSMNRKDFDMIALPGGLPNAFNLAQDELLQKITELVK